MFIDGFVHQLPDIDPQETGRVARVARRGHRRRRASPGPLPARPAHGAGARAGRRRPGDGARPTTSTRSRPSRSRGSRATRTSSAGSARTSVGTRWRWSTASNHRFDGLGGHLSTFASAAGALRRRLQPLLPGQVRRRLRRPDLLPGPRGAGHLRACVPRRAAQRGAARPVPPRGRRRGLPVATRTRGACPTFWEFPTVSMGLGPLNAVYQARFNRYLLAPRDRRHARSKVWCFVGDGEMDEPESTAGLSLARARAARQPDLRRQLQPAAARRPGARQRQGHPGARGDLPRAGLERHQGGLGHGVGRAARARRRRRARQQDEHAPSTASSRSTRSRAARTSASTSSAPIRGCAEMVEHLCDEDLQRLPRGGHDYRKLYAAYKAAVEHEGSPTAILAKTVKGWTLGAEFEARNATHQIKKMTAAELKMFRDRLLPRHPRRRPRRRARGLLPPRRP